MPSNRLVNASQAARCAHLKVNGTRCGSPARRGRTYCCFHDSASRRNREFVLPIVEDAASLQLALNRIMQALVDKRLDQKTASTLLYGLQIAFANLKQLKIEQRVDEIDRRQRASREQQQLQASAHADRPGPHPGKIPPAAASEPASSVDDFLRKIINDKSPAANDPDPPIAKLDIKACAEPSRTRQSAIGNAFRLVH